MKILSPLPTAPQTTPTAQPAAHHNRFSVSRTAGTMPIYTPKVDSMGYATTTTDTPKTSIGPAGPSFKDVLDIVNPLQHIPFVSNIYRKVTGDEISSPARVIGATLFGGPISGALALADTAVKEQTGTSVTEKIFNLVSDNTKTNSIPKALASTNQYRHYENRTAGAMPIWDSKNNTDARFAEMMNDLSGKNNNIS